MRPALVLFRRANAWLAALLILSQPLAPLDCRCANKHTAVASDATLDHSSPACCRKHGCHNHKRMLVAVTPRGVRHGSDHATLPLPGGCHCPPTCPCHVQHAPLDFAITNILPDAKVATVEWISFAPYSAVTVAAKRKRIPNRAVADADGANSVPRCALLCRFVV